MGPENFEAKSTMTSTREDGSQRSYEMKMLKSGKDKFRIYFLKPSAVAGQEILRSGDNNWLYLPQLKRSSRIASRESFQGGDFNNADILRVNYQIDYSALLIEANEAKGQSLLELKSKSDSSSYDKIRIWVDTKTGAPHQADFFGSSGKKMRSAEYLNYEKLDGKVARPKLIKMKNELIPSRVSELSYSSFKVDLTIPEIRFAQTDLGK